MKPLLYCNEMLTAMIAVTPVHELHLEQKISDALFYALVAFIVAIIRAFTNRYEKKIKYVIKHKYRFFR